MTDEMTIRDPEAFTGNLLPYNYLPAAFSQLAALDTAPDKPGRIVFLLPDPDENPRAGIQYHVVPGNVFGISDALTCFLADRRFSDADSFRRCILGPPTMMDKTEVGKPLSLDFERLKLADADAFDQVAVVIDIGIAFWNDRFRTGTPAKPGSRFKAMRYLNFDALLSGNAPFSGLSEAEIAAYCQLSDQPGGSDIVAAQIGRQFPDCYFDPGGGGVPDALWHGTATSDLMAGLAPYTPNKTALFGIELPMAVLRDADGDNLTSVLALLIEAAVKMTADFADRPLTILLAWGFSAGLQDGSHPAAVSIQNVLSAQKDRKITLLVPAGNQLQDRCCAHLTPSITPVPKQIIWQVPPDDFSINTVEFFITAPVPAGVQALRISPPAGAGFVIAIKENHWAALLRAGQIVGIVARFPDVGANARLRLSLAPTGWQFPGKLPCPSGDWTVSFARKDDVSLWILRDDRDFMLDGPLPRRASAFFDEAYEERDPLGSYFLIDNPGSAVVRSGTISVLATAKVIGPPLEPDQPVCDRVLAVQANEQMIGLPERQAFYSGRRVDGLAIEKTAPVDWGRPGSGVQVAANGTHQRRRITGTSAAVAMYGRRHLRIPPDAL